MIRVQTNGLPNHCFDYNSDVTPDAIETDWQVRFQPEVDPEGGLTQVTLGVASSEHMICSGYNASTKTIPWESRYKELIVFEKVDDGEEGAP